MLSGETNEDEDSPFMMPTIAEIVESSSFQETLLSAEFPDNIKTALKTMENSIEHKENLEMIRLIFFAKFLLNRVAVTVITAENESYAFDMFESLNTTGEPLTAFETFRPKVIHAEKLSDYEKSPSHCYIKPVEDYLDAEQDAKKKQSITSDFIISFRLAEDGKKMSRHLSEQRRYLITEYESWRELEDKRHFVQRMSFHAEFFKYLWKDKESVTSGISSYKISSFDDETIMCLNMLQRDRHSVVIPLVVRFFSEVLLSAPEDQIVSQQFCEAVKAITAFSVIRRAATGGTKGIDRIYRVIMAGSDSNPRINAFSFKKRQGPLSSQELKSYFKLFLEIDCIDTVEQWASKVQTTPIYTASKEFSRILLYFATHNTVADTQNAGLPQIAKSGVAKLLTTEKWREDFEIEHIAPRNRASGWTDALYQDSELIHTLGNLTLLPRSENASFSDREWRIKKLMYRLLSAKTEGELNNLLQEADKEGIELKSTTQTILKNANFLAHAEAIAQAEDWTPELIKKRSQRMAEIIWDRLFAWLM